MNFFKKWFGTSKPPEKEEQKKPNIEPDGLPEDLDWDAPRESAFNDIDEQIPRQNFSKLSKNFSKTRSEFFQNRSKKSSGFLRRQRVQRSGSEPEEKSRQTLQLRSDLRPSIRITPRMR